MTFSPNTPGHASGPTPAQIAIALFGLVAPVLTFFLAISTLPDSVKIFLLVVLASGYSFICFWAFQKHHASNRSSARFDSGSDELEHGINAIGEASEFFGSSLKPIDVFRLVSSRVSHVFPFTNSALFVASENSDMLQISQADGPNADILMQQSELTLEHGVAGMAWVSGEIEIDNELRLERSALPPEALDGVRSAVAIPLLRDGQSFAVFVLYTETSVKPDPAMRETLEAIGDRVAPLLLGSISFERSLANALTDSLTRLPNERAFYMVLENQLAESQRFRSERPLTIVSIDIKNFADTNKSFGYAAGDRMLAFAAEHLTSQLRKMDFLSRSANDEFLIILPKASEKFTGEIIARIKQRFAAEPFHVTESEDIKVWLNFGWATFWQDGETAEQLLQSARVRKQQAKAEEPTKVLWFPKEYVN